MTIRISHLSKRDSLFLSPGSRCSGLLPLPPALRSPPLTRLPSPAALSPTFLPPDPKDSMPNRSHRQVTLPLP